MAGEPMPPVSPMEQRPSSSSRLLHRRNQWLILWNVFAGAVGSVRVGPFVTSNIMLRSI